MTIKINDDIFDGVDASTVDDIAITYPIMQWVHGDPKLNSGDILETGGFFLSDEYAPGPLPEPFVPFEYRTRRGKTVPGFAARDLTVAFIGFRRRWNVGDGSLWFPYNAFDQAKLEAQQMGETLRGKAHVLLAIKGLEMFGPFVLTMSGSVSRAFFSGSNCVVSRLRKTLQVPARDIGRKQRGRDFPGLPLHGFWIRVGPEQDQHGKPVYTEVGSGQTSIVTLPTTLHLPIKPVRELEELRPHLVEREMRTLFDEWYHEAESWAQAWNKVPGDAAETLQAEEPPSAESDGEVQAPNRHVYEEPDDDDDIPF